MKSVLDMIREILYVKTACLNIAKDGFILDKYLEMKNKKIVESENLKSVKLKSKKIDNKDKPLLYALLRWRKEKAEELEKDEYQILPTAVVNRIAEEVEKVYPDWLLELALLLQTDNMHVAIEKTLPSAPAVLKKDLEQLSDDLITHPNDLTPYASFFSFLSLPSVHSSMKLLYSIAEFGATDESLQLSELIERNNTLMDRAERMKNDDKVAIIFLIKFLPTLMCSLKMMVDLFVFLLGYMAIMM